MLFVSFFKWWYSDGWRRRARLVNVKLDGVIDYFSIDLLVKTLFQPFRQDSTGRVDGTLGDKMHALADNMISRVLGAFIRTVILLFGIVTITLYALGAVVVLVFWGMIPVIPILGVVLAAFGVVF